MGKKRKRLTMAKYAKKYAAIREALLGKKAEPSPVIVEAEPIIEQPKVEEVVVEPRPKPKPKPKPKAKPKAKSASGKKKAAPKKSAPRKKKE